MNEGNDFYERFMKLPTHIFENGLYYTLTFTPPIMGYFHCKSMEWFRAKCFNKADAMKNLEDLELFVERMRNEMEISVRNKIGEIIGLLINMDKHGERSKELASDLKEALDKYMRKEGQP